MLHRERALLLMLKRAAKRASKTQMTKWAFLMRQCTDARDDETFYDFFPHRYGPYSFQLAHEMQKLTSRKYIRCEHGFSLSPMGVDATRDVREALRCAVTEVMGRFGGLNGTELTDFVYAHWPWFTVNSRQVDRRRGSRPKATLRVYTVGYEGLHVDAFLNGLMRSGIEGIIDVRRHPLSRRYGYHKSTLQRLLRSIGVRYSHFEELGIETGRRTSLVSQRERRRLVEWYALERLPANEEVIARVSGLIRQRPSALLCMEADHTICHRTPLAKSLSERLELPVDHLDLSG